MDVFQPVLMMPRIQGDLRDTDILRWLTLLLKAQFLGGQQ